MRKTETAVADHVNQFSTDRGPIVITSPAVLDEADALEACEWLDLIKSKLKRSIDPATTQNARTIKPRPVTSAKDDDDDEQPKQAVARPRTGP